MRQTAIDYFEELNTADFTIISDYGISETEQEWIEKDSRDKEIKVTVSGICEMYAGHFMFMNKTEYANICGNEAEINPKLLIFNDTSVENTQEQAAKFMELSCVKGIVQNTTLYNQINTISVGFLEYGFINIS